MKCALIFPAWTPVEIFPAATASSQSNYWQPLGLLYVGAALIEAGHEVSFFDGAFMTHEQIIDRVREWEPGFVGIYSTTFGWPQAKRTARDIKSADQQIFICAGGPYPIALGGRCLSDAAGDIDAVITGEGEQTVPKLLARLETSGNLTGVRGVAFLDGGRVIANPPRPLIEDLDALPFPARHLLGDCARYIPAPGTYRRKPVAIVLTSRGCTRRCIFCFQLDKERKSGRWGVRYRSIGNVMAEIEQLLAEGYREIKFIDDTFAADNDRALELAEEIKARRLDFPWFASLCVNQANARLLRTMKDAGCWSVLMAAESGVQKNLNTLRKGSTLDQIREAVKMAKDAGLRVSVPFMFGIPGETVADGLKTIDFAIELNPDLANFHALTPFPGTHLHDHRNDYGAVSGDLSDFTYQGAAFVPATMTRDDIRMLRQKAFRRFYSRPSFIFRRLLQIRTWKDFLAAASGVKSLFGLWKGRDLFRRPDAGGGPGRPHPLKAAGIPGPGQDIAGG
ncbi:MAG: B12-binding domain-containing radical SAM protein [Rhodospirillaceae bacterium]|jgi:radical SAM superfamily enzyme YgiQ (UPF0313 family)|nr:B12-binding domain-containing radical SAM protein [Rhodospirillaceae bacterium]|tara:strand:+ start:5182 stop:6705 length:1524 start_codon:yes stop_codon:yes gene_type:complete